MNKIVIPIVFAINEGYVPYCGVAIQSIIENSSIDNQYNIYVFFSKLSSFNISRLEGMSTKNIKIKCMNVADEIPEVSLKNKNHVSKETVYRICAPYILKEYDKILYLDSDMVMLSDVAAVYNTDIGNCILGAVEEKHLDWFEDYLEERNININGYFNSGVLLLNTKKIIEENILQKTANVLNDDIVYNYPDQDALNIVCDYKDVFYLPDEWNVTWHLIHNIDHVISDHVNRIIKTKDNIKILHFTSAIKAWKNPGKELAYYFWKFARNTQFYEEILFTNICAYPVKEDIYERHIFPWSEIKKNSHIVIYGYGVVGKTFLKQIEEEKYCTIVAVADKNKNATNFNDIPIIKPEEIKNYNYDLILIAIERNKVAKHIRQELIELGYNDSEIIWVNPLKQ